MFSLSRQTSAVVMSIAHIAKVLGDRKLWNQHKAIGSNDQGRESSLTHNVINSLNRH